MAHNGGEEAGTPPCAGRMEMFFSNGDPEIFVAKRLCARCAVRPSCLELGLSFQRRTGHVNGTGIYGGLTERERRNP